MEHLITVVGLTKLMALFLSFSITLGAGLGLLLLFLYSKKDTFYPAMPFISMGCFAGWGLILIILTTI